MASLQRARINPEGQVARMKVRFLLFSLSLLACPGALACDVESIFSGSSGSAQGAGSGPAGEQAIYREYLRQASCTSSPASRADSSIALVDLILDRAQHGSANREALHENAMVLIKDAQKTSKVNGLFIEYARLLQLQWVLYLQKNESIKGLELLPEAIDYLQRAEAPADLIAEIYKDLSYTYILAGELSSAKTYLRRAVVLTVNSGDDDLKTEIILSIADAYRKTAELEVATRYYRQAFSINDAKDNDFKYDALLKLGTLDREQGHIEEAVKKHLASYEFFKNGNYYRSLVAEIELARDFLVKRDFQQSSKYALLAFNDSRAFSEQKLDAVLILMKSDPGNWKKWSNEIQSILEDAIEKSGTDVAHPIRQLEHARLELEYVLDSGDADLIRQVGDNGLRVFTRLRDDLKRSEEAYHGWIASAKPFISTYIKTLYYTDKNRLFDVLEKTYSISPKPAQLENTRLLNQQKEPAEIALLEAYLGAEKSVVDASSDWEETRNSANREKLEQLKARRDLAREAYLESRNSTEGETSREHEVVETGPAKIGAGDLFLRYYLQEDISLLLARHADGEEIIELPARSEIRKLVEKIDERFLSGGSTRAKRLQLLGQLRALLPIQLLQDREFDRLVILPDDEIHRVPFSAINLGNGDRVYKPVSGKYRVTRTHSAYQYYAANKPGHINGETNAADILVFADPHFDEHRLAASSSATFRNWSRNLARLPHTADEARQIVALFPDKKTAVFQGKEATGAILLSEQARSANVLHIATHGYYNQNTPDIVGVATAVEDRDGNPQRGFLSLSALLSKPYNSDLIVISGCETMLGKEYDGFGVQGLAQAFIAQGAGSVVGTLWKVADKPTSIFMRYFYEALKSNGGNSSLALNTARNRLASMGRYRDPIYWAAFVLTSANTGFEKNILL